MALSLPATGPLRISQILPTIKCSRCGQDIDINFADEHVCKPTPGGTAPSSPPKTPEPQRPLSRNTDRESTVSSFSVPSVSSYSSHSRSSTSTKRALSIRSTHTVQQSPPAEVPSRTRFKSGASYHSYRSGSSIDEDTRRGSPPPRSSPSPTPTTRSGQLTSPIGHRSPSPILRSGPSPAPSARSIPTSMPPRSSPSPTPSSRTPPRTTPSPVPTVPVSRTPEPPAVVATVAPLVPRKMSRSGSGPLPPQPPPPTHAPPPPDTSTGGEAGMAGVGRRAFAAVAQVALFASNGHPRLGAGLSPTSIYGYPGQILVPTSPIDGRFSSLSGYLNVNTDLGEDVPPLSPSFSPATPSSATPRSPEEDPHSPGAEIARANSRSPSPVDVIDGSGSRAVSKGKGVVGGLSSLASKLRRDASDAELSSTAAGKQPLRTASPEPIAELERGRSRAVSNAGSQAESETELAYGRSPSPSPERRKLSVDSLKANQVRDGEENTIAFPRRGSNASDHPPKRTGSQSSSRSSSSSGSQSGSRRVKQSAGAQTLSALREEDEDDVRSAYTSPSSAEVDGAFKVTPVVAFVDEPTVTAITAANLDSLGVDNDANRLNLPPRAPTAASVYSSASSRRKRVRTCAKCEKRIEDGRWIKIDDGNGGNTVLCEQDWKMLYLPKCRQCGLAIETQAIYASDGQLKGKYHKECFSCYSCHKPFPDRSFYVYQERPYCKYHYHEANNSLCASPSCRDPIEGPCAVSYSGARYHPEHFTCEYEDEDGRCSTLLKEYWEISGESLCERHAIRSTDNGARAIKAKKRQTQYLNLGSVDAGRDLC